MHKPQKENANNKNIFASIGIYARLPALFAMVTCCRLMLVCGNLLHWNA
jgi:hypothetical protein